jgi:hypothetical protein
MPSLQDRKTSAAEEPEGGGVVGGVFGLLLGALISFWWWFGLSMGWLALVPIVAVPWVGARYGDRFWYWFLERFDWFS